MFEILAIAEAEGSAYVRYIGKIYFVRPPYYDVPISGSGFTEQEFQEWLVASATKHGFVAGTDNMVFADDESLIKFLQETADAAHPDRERLSGPELGKEFLRIASYADINEWLVRVKEELIPGRRLEHATKLLLAIVDELSLRTADLDKNS